MKLTVTRYSVEVIPESPQDEAYIEEVLGLKKEGDCVVLTRKNISGCAGIAYLEAKKSMSYEELKKRLEGETVSVTCKPQPEFVPTPFHVEPKPNDAWKTVKFDGPEELKPPYVVTYESKGETK